MKKITQIPQFKNYQDEARFWDTHSIADFSSEMKRVKANIRKPIKMTFSGRLDKETINKLDNIAKEKGMGARTLAQMWLLAKLKEQYSS